jgi:hypothetical protein
MKRGIADHTPRHSQHNPTQEGVAQGAGILSDSRNSSVKEVTIKAVVAAAALSSVSEIERGDALHTTRLCLQAHPIHCRLYLK